MQVQRENVGGVPGLSTAYQHNIVSEQELWTEARQGQEEGKEDWTAWMTMEGRIVYKSQSGETQWSHPALDLQPLPPGWEQRRTREEDVFTKSFLTIWCLLKKM